MITIKIKNKDFEPIATLFETEFTNLQYDKKINKVGSANFRVQLRNDKVNENSLQHYNIIEVLEKGVVKFVGFIMFKKIDLNVVDIRCKSLIGILDKRIVGGEYIANGALNVVTEALMDNINTAYDTGISVGRLGINDPVNKTFNSASPLEILQSFADSVECQFEVDEERKLNIDNNLGEDLSESVFFQYDVKQVSSSNILGFDVTDDGDSIITKAYGKSDTLDSTQTSVAGVDKFGCLESFTNFRVASSQADLDAFTNVQLRDNLFSPDIELSPDVEDNFDVGDTVRVKLRNSLISIDDSFQVLEKTVKYTGQQRRISIRISDLPIGFVEISGEINKRLKLLEKNV